MHTTIPKFSLSSDCDDNFFFLSVFLVNISLCSTPRSKLCEVKPRHVLSPMPTHSHVRYATAHYSLINLLPSPLTLSLIHI